MRSLAVAGDGEPDGYDGIASRGIYERLVTSEWLLADEEPDEFDRRAAMGEHTFTRLARPAERVKAETVDGEQGKVDTEGDGGDW